MSLDQFFDKEKKKKKPKEEGKKPVEAKTQDQVAEPEREANDAEKIHEENKLGDLPAKVQETKVPDQKTVEDSTTKWYHQLSSGDIYQLLHETVRSQPQYMHFKTHVKSNIFSKNKNITAKELALHLEITLGEAYIILDDIRDEEG